MNTPPVTPTPETLAWAILTEAEATDAIKSMVEERAGCGNLPTPDSINDYLFWIEDEAEIQEAQLETSPDETDRPPHLVLLRELAGRLRDLGFTPDAPPQAADEGEKVKLAVAAYAWLCPKCNKYQRVIEVTLTVMCVACGKSFSVADHHHVYG
jgi:hypothetical protein